MKLVDNDESDIKNNIGTAFIYSNLVKMGIELFEQVLINAGCIEYKPDGKYIINDNTLDYLTGLTFSEFKKKNIKRRFHPITYFSITGTVDELEDQIREEKKIILDNVFNNIENKCVSVKEPTKCPSSFTTGI
jgi:hypothetical protein